MTNQSMKKGHKLHAESKGKQRKHFLNKDAALNLAAEIAGVQEERASTRAEKNSQIQAGKPHTSDQKPRISASKVKLKETKALLANKIAESKRERVRRRKARKEGSTATNKSTPSLTPEVPKARKKVAFA